MIHFERHKITWEPTASEPEVPAEKTWQLSQSSNTHGHIFWNKTGMSLDKKHGCTKDVDDMAKAWKEWKESVWNEEVWRKEEKVKREGVWPFPCSVLARIPGVARLPLLTLQTLESERESFGDEEHNVWNLLLGLFAHHNAALQQSLREEDVCNWLCRATQPWTSSQWRMQMARVRRCSGARSSGG